jgi:hypothetical protein
MTNDLQQSGRQSVDREFRREKLQMVSVLTFAAGFVALVLREAFEKCFVRHPFCASGYSESLT